MSGRLAKPIERGIDSVALFYRLLDRYQIQRPVPEFRFAPPRMWRFDFAFPASRVALEVEGGVWTGGRHTRGKGFLNDCEKYSEAAVLGWAVIRVPPNKLLELETIDLIRRAMQRPAPQIDQSR